MKCRVKEHAMLFEQRSLQMGFMDFYVFVLTNTRVLGPKACPEWVQALRNSKLQNPYV